MTSEIERVFKLEGVNNFRDFGGWRAAEGTRVVTGRLFRCAHLHHATNTDIAHIGSLGIATVTDLRRPGERQAQPSAWIGKLSLKLIEEPAEDRMSRISDDAEPPHLHAFRASDRNLAAMREFLAAHYAEMPFDVRHVALFRRYFEALARGDGAMLIHCAAGKDRTGILAWLTHRLLGVHPDDAMEDFLLSNSAADIADRLPQARRFMEKVCGASISDEAIGALLSVEPNYIQRCEAALVARSGSVDGYLADVLAVDAVQRDRIRTELLA